MMEKTRMYVFRNLDPEVGRNYDFRKMFCSRLCLDSKFHFQNVLFIWEGFRTVDQFEPVLLWMQN